MTKRFGYQPPHTITPGILSRVGEINEWIGRHSLAADAANMPRLRRENRIRSIQSSLAIEGNQLNLDQVTAILNGKRVLGLPRDIQEVRNAFNAYEMLDRLHPTSCNDLLAAHGIMTAGLVDDPGQFRHGGVGVFKGKKVVHMAPPAARVPTLINDLLAWLKKTDTPPLIASCVFHYEFEFIHPFSDGNGRMGRLWQTLILTRWRPIFALVPVESMVHDHQADYYAALNACNRSGESTVFIEFMLTVVQAALTKATGAEQVTEQVTEQVIRLLGSLNNKGQTTRDIMKSLKLRHRPTFLYTYLKPALAAGLAEMSQPNSATSPTQLYRLTDKGRAYARRINT